MPRPVERRAARTRQERARRILERDQPAGEHVLTLEVWLSEEGQVSVKVDTDRGEVEVAALLDVVAEQIRPNRTRAEETEAWGSGRRNRR